MGLVRGWKKGLMSQIIAENCVFIASIPDRKTVETTSEIKTSVHKKAENSKVYHKN